MINVSVKKRERRASYEKDPRIKSKNRRRIPVSTYGFTMFASSDAKLGHLDDSKGARTIDSQVSGH